jgi:hypothetical protein
MPQHFLTDARLQNGTGEKTPSPSLRSAGPLGLTFERASSSAAAQPASSPAARPHGRGQAPPSAGVAAGSDRRPRRRAQRRVLATAPPCCWASAPAGTSPRRRCSPRRSRRPGRLARALHGATEPVLGDGLALAHRVRLRPVSSAPAAFAPPSEATAGSPGAALRVRLRLGGASLRRGDRLAARDVVVPPPAVWARTRPRRWPPAATGPASRPWRPFIPGGHLRSARFERAMSAAHVAVARWPLIVSKAQPAMSIV